MCIYVTVTLCYMSVTSCYAVNLSMLCDRYIILCVEFINDVDNIVKIAVKKFLCDVAQQLLCTL